jgi:GTP-binding protein HflX
MLDKKKNVPIRTEPERAILVGLVLQGQPDEQAKEYLDELEFLASTAGALTTKRFTQKLDHPEHRTFVGKGKLEEIRQYVEENDIDLAIFDDDLTGKQSTSLEETLKVKILDRSMLILDIFASRAQTAQAKTQVELAQMQYLFPRLRGMWTHLERQRGGIGMRGPGEQEIETDRRIVKDKIALLKERLELIERQSFTQRKSRDAMVRVALVGYTNVGKSTLMNLLSKSEVLAENKLFATLDTTVRKVVFERMPFLLSDTVGFIRKLPHHLVESFKSTLDETRESDILLHVVDMSHPQFEEQMTVVRQTLSEIGAGDKPVLYVFNKIDLWRERVFDPYLAEDVRQELEAEIKAGWTEKLEERVVFLSAIDREGIEQLRTKMYDMISRCYVERYPHQIKHW